MVVSENWPQFRGPGGAGVGTHPRLPVSWAPGRGIAWSIAMPGRSWSSPVIASGRVLLTSVVRPSPGEAPRKGLYFGGERPDIPTEAYRFRVHCLDLESGRTIWETTVHEGAPKTSIHLKNSYGAETPVVAGDTLVALFGGLGMFGLDIRSGKVRWERRHAPRKTRFGWGSASSPVAHGGLVLHVDDNDERSEMTALDIRDGRPVWRVDRDEKSNWATPFVWRTGSRVEIVTAGSRAVRSYDLDGKLLWSLRGMSSIAIPTPIAGDGLLFVTSGYVGDALRPLYAIRPGASGDITLPSGEMSSRAIAWSSPTSGPYNPTPVHHDGRLYVLFDRGLLSCHDARTGKKLYDRERLPEGFAFTSSPWVASGRVFCLNEEGKCFVVRAGDRFELENVLRFGADEEMCMASPAMSGDRLVVRTAERVLCLRGRA